MNTTPGLVIQNINAPVYGHVAGRDVNIHYAAAAEEDAPLTWADRPMGEVTSRLRDLRRQLRRWQLAYWINWPSLFFWAWLLGVGGAVINTLISSALGAHLQPVSLWIFALPVLLLLGAIIFMMEVQKFRNQIRYIAFDLEAEVSELERVLALKRAGRL